MGAEVVVNVEVVLATHNGELFLEQQLQSLRQQKLRPTRVLIFDDGSSDSTNTILDHWQKRYPTWIHLLKTLQEQLGPTAAFNRLLLNSTAPYVALCDQDDVWHPDRLAIGIDWLQHAEANHLKGSNQPLLLHSDAELIDGDGNHLSQTLWEWHRCSGQQPELIHLAQHNTITGCTILVNRALLHEALPLPCEAIFHDHWLALVALERGDVLSCPQQLLAHRRHSRNSSSQHKQPKNKFGYTLHRSQRKHTQWLAFCRRYRLSTHQRVCWWTEAVFQIMRVTIRRIRNLK